MTFHRQKKNAVFYSDREGAPKMGRHNTNAGFTIVEMITVVAIFSSIAGVVLANLTQFNSSVLTENIAQDIALIVRESQAKAVSGVTDSFFAENTKPSWGVKFDSEEGTFFHFADLNNNNRYNPADNCASGNPAYECRDRVDLPEGFVVGKLCAISVLTGEEECDMSTLTITFERPEQTPYVINQDTNEEYTRVSIEVRNPEGISKFIIIGRLGEITVN